MENLGVAKKIARPARRVVAFVIDVILIGVGDFLICLPAITALINALTSTNGSTVLGAAVLCFLCGGLASVGSLLYIVLLPYSTGGQTLGMIFLGLRMSDEKGSKIQAIPLFTQAALMLLLTITTFGVNLLVDLISLFLAKDRRTFVDALSGIYVLDLDV